MAEVKHVTLSVCQAKCAHRCNCGLTIRGATNYFQIKFKACSARGTTCDIVSLGKTLVWGNDSPRGQEQLEYVLLKSERGVAHTRHNCWEEGETMISLCLYVSRLFLDHSSLRCGKSQAHHTGLGWNCFLGLSLPSLFGVTISRLPRKTLETCSHVRESQPQT